LEAATFQCRSSAKAGKGFLRIQDHVDGAAGIGQGGVVERAFLEHGGEACGDQQGVAFAQGDLHFFHEVEQHLAAGLGVAGFHERQVARRDVGFQRQVELGKAATLAPGAQQGTNGLRAGARG